MSFNYTSPEKMGIHSENILAFIKKLDELRMATHEIIIMRGNNIVHEAYWKPFNKDFKHRMYSVTKSFVSLAIGFLEQDGLIDLDDEIIKYFPDEMKEQKDINMRRQTIRNMLMMSTAKPERNWFEAAPEDRVRFYFENDTEESRPGGTIFEYDSGGTFILCVLVERITGMDFLDYLREKVLNRVGFSKDAYCLKCPGGHSWGDSAIICTPQDLLRTARFVMNKGKWDGEQLLNEAYVTEATSALIPNTSLNDVAQNVLGYGYYIWRTYDNSFAFMGMGGQFAICVPDKDVIVVINSDNQGKEYSERLIFDNLFDMVIRNIEDKELPDNPEAQRELNEHCKTLKLAAAVGDSVSPIADKISGKTYTLADNPMGITKLSITFNGDKGELAYTNAQGDKKLPFGMCENVFDKFPQSGYSDMVGTQSGDRLYDCAASAAWISDDTLMIKVQIIDTYFGNLHIKLGYKGDELGVFMVKTAEDFLDEYQGYASGHMENI